MIEVLKSKDGNYTIKVNGIFQHSKYDVIKEGENFYGQNISNLKVNNLIIVGLGLGYHILEVLKNINNDVSLKVFEFNQGVYDYSSKYGVLDKILKFKNVEVINKDSINKFSNEISKNDDVILYKPAIKAMDNLELRQLLLDFDVSRKSIIEDSGLLTENYLANKNIKHKFIDDFLKNINEKNILVVSAGPSLDYEIENLKKYKDKIFIISVGSALRTLMNKDIIPNAVVIIDGQEVVKNQIRDFENEKFDLLFLNTASKWAVEGFKGNKYMFFNSKQNESRYIITTGGTVGLAAISIATECKPKNIIILGQDLAILDNKTHTKFIEETYNKVDLVDKSRYCKSVTGVDNEELKTDLTYLYFKRKIENFINANRGINYINCSKGARIQGTIEKDFSSAMNLLLAEE